MRLFADLLRERTGQDLALGRRWRIETALRPLLKALGIASLDRLAAMIGDDEALAVATVDALLNNETYFFRDPAAFRALLDDAIAPAALARAASRRLRIWCAGCSTGQEVYSIAMMLAAEPARWAGWTIELTGTDICATAIAQAREGSYSGFEIQRGLPVREMMRWFEADGERWRARPELRARVRFAVCNLLDPWPLAGRFDIVLCRNLLLYLAPARRRQAFARLAERLCPDGRLMLGAGETVLGQTALFAPDPLARGLYRPLDAATGTAPPGSAAA